MTYSDLSALLLAVAALFVGVIVPLFGAYGYILAKHQAVAKSQEVVMNEMKDGGILRDITAKIVSEELRDDSGLLKQYIFNTIKEELDRQTALNGLQESNRTDNWGNEKDEYGEYSLKEEREC